LLNQLGTDFSRIFAPWLELSAEGMKQHYSFGFSGESVEHANEANRKAMTTVERIRM